MNTKYICLLLLLFSLGVYAQTPDQPIKREVDSLRHSLAKARHDTERVMIRYRLGKIMMVSRLSYWDSIAADAQACGMKRLEGLACNMLGHLLWEQGAYKRAFFNYNKSYWLARKIGEKQDMLYALSGMILYYFDRQDYSNTLRFYYRSLKLMEEVDNNPVAAYLFGIAGSTYFAIGDYPKALAIHKKSLVLYRTLNDSPHVAQTLCNIGSDYVGLKDNARASFHYLESKKYIRSISDPFQTSAMHNSIGSAYIFQKQYDSACAYIGQACAYARQSGDQKAIASTLTNLASAYFEKGDLRLAKTTALEAFGILNTTSFQLQIPALANVLKNIYMKEGNATEALKMYELSVTTRDSLTSSEHKKQALQREYEYNLEKKEDTNKLLAQQNQIQALQLGQNKFLLWGMGCLILTLALMGFLLMRQNRLRTEHQRLQLEQKLLRSQMNPHFIFNCLNSIQQFIMSGKNDQAEWYLTKFAGLIRELLESSLKENLSVKEEVNLLKVYLEMESLRFGDAFDYSVKVDERIDADSTLIPQLMVQPFVENAIWHGLLPKNNDRKLEVAFEYAGNRTVRCVVDDNGVGREASAKKEKIFRKKSLALTFAKQRIGLIRETYKTTGDICLIDKKDVDGKSAGTTVVITLPIL